MNKWIVLLLLLLLVPIAALAPLSAGALPVPPLSAHVNDYGHMISPATARDLEQELTRFEGTDSTQVVILTVPSLEGENLEEFSIKVAEAWKIGSKGIDNGVILLIARDDRKVRIEVGRGLEGRLTDLTSGRIVRERIIPLFRRGDFDGGIRAGVDGIIGATRGEYTSQDRAFAGAGGRRSTPIFTLLIFLFIALVFAGALSKVLGAAVGTVGLPAAAKLSFPALSYPLLGGLGLLGLVMGLLVHALFTGHGRSGPGRKGGGGFWGGFGGGLLGGTFFGGGSGRGDDSFGGFSGGGGDFGGGGASGDW